MPASFVVAANCGATGVASASAITTSSFATTTGQYVFVHASHYTSGRNVSAVTVTGATMTKAGTTQGGDANQDSEIWYSIDPVVGTTTAIATVIYDGLAAFRLAAVAVFSWGGITSISYEAESTHALLSGSAKASNTCTTLTDDDLLIGGWVAYDYPHNLSNGTATIGTVENPGAPADDYALGYRLAASASAYTVTLIGNNTYDRYSVICKAFKGVTGAGTTTAANLYTLTLTNSGS